MSPWTKWSTTMTPKILGVVTALAAALALAGPAPAAVHVASFDYAVTNADGSPSQQAGAHPFAVTTAFTFPGHDDGSGHLTPAAAGQVTPVPEECAMS